ncbi:MAG: hypothetical protein WBP22_03595 [Candidatus Saccharimonas sp.]
MRITNTPDHLKNTNVISIEYWLALHPGRLAIQLSQLSYNHEAVILDIWPRIAARRIAERQQATSFAIALPYNANLDVWKRPETD